MAAILVHWFALTRDGRDWKMPTTASAWRHLEKYLWPEVHKWARLLNWQRIGRDAYVEGRELLFLSLKLSTGQAFAIASDDAAALEGAHADHLFFLYDEAKVIPDDTYDATEGAFSGSGDDTDREAYALAISTPGDVHGRFYDIHRKAPGLEDWHTRHVTLTEAAAAGRISMEWADQRKKQWGEESTLYQNRVLGNFSPSDEDSVIPLWWVEQAQARWRAWRQAGGLIEQPLTAVGVDVADGGKDGSGMAPRYGSLVPEIMDLTVNAKHRTMELTGRIMAFLERVDAARVIVDVVGVGAGVYSRIVELQETGGLDDAFELVPFSAGAATKAVDVSGEIGFQDTRSAAWWGLRERLDPESGEDLMLPENDRLTGDLTAPRWGMTSRGRIKVESKDDIKRRLKRSTDFGDMVVQAFWEPVIETGPKRKKPQTAPVTRGISLWGGASVGGR